MSAVTEAVWRNSLEVPTRQQYKSGLLEIERDINKVQRKILRAHYYAHNLTSTAMQLGVGADVTYHTVNAQYGALARKLGETIDMKFDKYVSPGRAGNDYYGSTISQTSIYIEKGTKHLQIVMHFELWSALNELGWMSPEWVEAGA
jgi:hypothetical protein